MTETPSPESTQRFSNRTPFYHQYRPRYPQAVIETLKTELGLLPEWIIADVGSGTGISSELFLKNGNLVFGVEPNDEMRAESVTHYGSYENFKPQKGTAEATGLPEHSVDLVTAGQAFHWFDLEGAKREFGRILKSPEQYVVLFWNTRKAESSPFMTDFQALVQQYSVDFQKVQHGRVFEEEARALSILYNGSYERRVFSNDQVLDYAGLKGRVLSASYAPLEGHPNYAPMLTALEALFAQYQRDGQVTIEYATQIYWGRV